MTAKEYLLQAQFLEKAISSRLQEMEYWKSLSENVSGIGLEEHFNPNRPQEAPFVHCVEKIAEIQKEVDEKTAELIALRKEIDYRIGLLNNLDEQLILRYRYLNHYSWKEVQYLMGICKTVAFEKHRNALYHFRVP